MRRLNMQKDTVREKIEKHPCYCRDAHDKYSRIHLPVAPACNIQCNYCNRKYDCSNESRPGVTSGTLSPEQALERVITVEQTLDNLSVIGIAGPGDALANPTATFQTLRLLKEYNSSLIPCLSTNGLNLPDYVDEIGNVGVNHVTVTMNAVDPEIGAEIYRWIHFKDKTYHGKEGASILLDRQMEGIKMLIERGILVKVNSVLIPGINEDHIKEVARVIKDMGVFIHNIIPLMSKPEYGTKFAKDGVPEPSIESLAKVQFDCAEIMGGFNSVMTHCRQCRADAVGKLGQDMDMTVQSDEVINISDALKSQVMSLHRFSRSEMMQKEFSVKTFDRSRMVLTAVATENNYMSDVSFKNARTFYVYEVSGWGAHLREIRTLKYEEDESCIKLSGHLKNVRELLSDCDVVVCAAAGKSAFEYMADAGIILNTDSGYRLLEESAWSAGKTMLTDRKPVTA